MTQRIIAVTLAVLMGGWMVTDGLHCIIRGKYIGPEKPGPWSAIFNLLRIDPFKIAPLFVLLGILWIAGMAVMLLSPPLIAQKAWIFCLALAVSSLWYLPIGTVVAVAYVLLLVLCKSSLLK
jgi:hypothetical protein